MEKLADAVVYAAAYINLHDSEYDERAAIKALESMAYEATGKSRPSSELRNACGARAPERNHRCARTVDERRAL